MSEIDTKEVLTEAQVADIRSDAVRFLATGDLGQGLIADMPLHVIALVDTITTLRSQLDTRTAQRDEALARAERLAWVVRCDVACRQWWDSGVGKSITEWEGLEQRMDDLRTALQPGDLGETEAGK